MTVTAALVVFVAGMAAGMINTIVGSGTLITFPVLVGLGLLPVTATMSNGIGLIPGNISGTWGYRRELRGQGRRLRQQIPASVLGAALGAWLLVQLPATAFDSIVPVLLVVALILVVAQPFLQRRLRTQRSSVGAGTSAAAASDDQLSTARLTVLLLCTFVAGVYGGYFAAAQGVLLVGFMGVLLHHSLQEVNAAKNLLTLLVNVVSAVGYLLIAAERIDWTAAALIAGGSLIGGFLGAGIGRRLSPVVLRCVIVALGVYAIWHFLTS